jgi:hypothetical protein
MWKRTRGGKWRNLWWETVGKNLPVGKMKGSIQTQHKAMWHQVHRDQFAALLDFGTALEPCNHTVCPENNQENSARSSYQPGSHVNRLLQLQSKHVVFIGLAHYSQIRSASSSQYWWWAKALKWNLISTLTNQFTSEDPYYFPIEHVGDMPRQLPSRAYSSLKKRREEWGVGQRTISWSVQWVFGEGSA